MRVDLIAMKTHYLDHLAPIWKAMDEDERGALIAPSDVVAYGKGIGVESYQHRGNDVALAAGWPDIKGAIGYRARALMEHGVGQTYLGQHPAYAGGKGRRGTVNLYLCPNDRVARANSELGKAEVIGDPYLDELRARERRAECDLVVVSHHWNCPVVGETQSTRRVYATAVSRVREATALRVARHAHPRDAHTERRQCAKNGVPFIERFADVARYAAVYVCDNSSTMFYAAALGIPVVVLNAPWYRRDVHHGLRFWEHADIGPNVWRPDELSEAVLEAASASTEYSEQVFQMVDDLFPVWDGTSSARAVDALRLV